MLSSFILHQEIQDFINQNLGNSISKLALQKNPFPQWDWKIILNQIEAKSKAKDKLPTWFAASNIVFPTKISIEQTSSEKTAQYKATLVNGDSLLDATGGFGIDSYYFAQKMKQVFHCEMNIELSEIVQHNFQQLEIINITCFNEDSEVILQKLNKKLDWIYIDPSRRNNAKGKVFMLQDCLPNVPNLLDFYFQFSTNILIKTAPILDISAGVSELKNVKEIHIVAVDNEVKELLWIIEYNYYENIVVKTINYQKEIFQKFQFIWHSKPEITFGLPQKFLYEPNAAIMKSGGFEEVAHQFQLIKLHPHSHLFTNSDKIDFCGRVFEIIEVIPYSKNELKKLENQKANITVRNFPESVDTIRKKWKIKDGGDLYCFFTTDINNNKIVLLCNQI
jgi:hypothetical protein